MIRKMQAADLMRVVEIEQQVFARPWSMQSFHSAYNQRDNIYLVYETEGVVRGYLGIWCAAEDGDLCNLAVEEASRRKGVAARLLAEGVGQCARRGVQRILLEVRVSNEPARRLYEQFGFTEIGRRQHYYTEPVEDALIMQCDTGTMNLS